MYHFGATDFAGVWQPIENGVQRAERMRLLSGLLGCPMLEHVATDAAQSNARTNYCSDHVYMGDTPGRYEQVHSVGSANSVLLARSQIVCSYIG